MIIKTKNPIKNNKKKTVLVSGGLREKKNK